MTPEQKKLKIRSLLARLDALEGEPVGKEVDKLLEQEAEMARSLVKNSPTTKAVKRLTEELDKVKKDPRVKNISATLQKTSQETSAKFDLLVSDFGAAITALQTELRDSTGRERGERDTQVKSVLERLDLLSDKFSGDYASLETRSALLESEASRVWQELTRIFSELSSSIDGVSSRISSAEKDTAEALLTAKGALDEIEKVEKSLISRISQIATGERGGGNMNRNIAVGGNQSVLSMFNDINIKPGNNVSLSYTNNQATGFVDLTISATGGGASVGGMVRSIETVATSQTIGSVTGTDYVYIASAGIQLQLPSATTNANLYTIKNKGVSSVLIVPDGADTIDTDANIILATQYTSVDLISDGVSNWNIT